MFNTELIRNHTTYNIYKSQSGSIFCPIHVTTIVSLWAYWGRGCTILEQGQGDADLSFKVTKWPLLSWPLLKFQLTTALWKML